MTRVLSAALPYRYAKARPGAPRFYSPPTSEQDALERAAASEAGTQPERASMQGLAVLERHLNGIHFVALDNAISAPAGEYYRTVRGRYLRAEDVTPRALPSMPHAARLPCGCRPL